MGSEGLEQTLRGIGALSTGVLSLLFSENVLELIQETLENKVLKVNEVAKDDKTQSEDQTLHDKIEEELVMIGDEEIPIDDEDVVDYSRLPAIEAAHYQLDPAAAEAFYKQTLNYDDLYSHMGIGKILTGHDVEYQEGVYTSEHSANIHNRKAEAVMSKIQQSIMLKSSERINIKDKEFFAYWQTFNKVLLALYHSTNMMRTSEVDYGTINTMNASLAF